MKTLLVKPVYLIVVAIGMFALPHVVSAQVIPTSEWVNLWSNATTLNNNPVPVNAVVYVYDRDGVLCGETTVTAAGSYGLLPVYRDDPFTTLVDEGAEPGDTLRLMIDDVPAQVLNIDVVVWTHNGDNIQTDIAVERLLPTSEWVSFWSGSSQIGDVPVYTGALIRAYDPDGVLCGEFTTVALGSYGLMPVYRDDPLTLDFDEGAEPGDVIQFTIEGHKASDFGPDDAVWSVNGHTNHVDLYVDEVPTFLLAVGLSFGTTSIAIEWTLSSAILPRHLTLLRQIEGSAGFVELSDVTIQRQETAYYAVDDDTETGVSYVYWLRVSSSDGQELLRLGTARIDPPVFGLLPGYPNPFREGTTFRIDLSSPTAVTVAIYDPAGHLVRRVLTRQPLPTGRNEVFWDGLDASGTSVPVGVYFVRVEAGRFQKIQKVTLIR
jgi:hypothetical protein